MAKNVLTGNFGKGAKVCLIQPGDAAQYGRMLLTYRNHSTHPLDPMSNHLPMPAPNQGSPNTKLNLNPIKVPTSSTRTPKTQIREKAMPLLNPICPRSREIRRGDMLLGPREVTPRLSNQKVPTNMYVFPPSTISFQGQSLMNRTLHPRHSLLPSILLTLPRRPPSRIHR